jgi:tRNA(fMet)-specific endonuclease VapC
MSDDTVRYILDTDTITYHQLGRSAIVARLTQLSPGQVATTVITMEEQLQGRLAAIRRQRDPDRLAQSYRLFQATQSYFCQLPVLPFDEVALARYRGLLEQRVRIGTQDLRIAAITLVNRAILVTSNQRHFGQLADLLIEDWTAAQ